MLRTPSVFSSGSEVDGSVESGVGRVHRDADAMIDRRRVDVNQFSGTSLAIDRSWTE